MSELKLLKSIWEIRYGAAAALFDNRGKIADRWYLRGEGFENWNIGRNHVRLTSKDGSHTFHIDYRGMIYEAEGWNLDDFCGKAARATGWATKLLRVRNIERVGFRLLHIVERESFEKAHETMMQRLFALNEEDWAVFGGRPIDIGFPLTLDFDESRANFKMGPMLRGEYAPLIQSDRIKDQIPEVSFLIDFDMFKKQPNFPRSGDISKEYRTFLEHSGRLMQNVSNNILLHFGGFK